MEGERDGLWSVSLSSQVLEHFRGERREGTGGDEDGRGRACGASCVCRKR